MMDLRITRLVSVQGFNRAFEEQMSKHPTMEEAYESIEKLYSKHYNTRRFKNYDSFRMSRKYHMKKAKSSS